MARVFVRNLNATTTEADLNVIFSRFGAVQSCQVYRKRGHSMRVAFVEFGSQAEADAAIVQGNGMCCPDQFMFRPLVVQQFVYKQPIGQALAPQVIQPPVDANQINAQAVPQLKRCRYECGICFESKTEDSVTDYGCGHRYCTDCVRQYFHSLVTNGSVQAMKCPNTGCNHMASEGLLKRSMTTELFAKYERLMLKAATDHMEDIMTCPDPKCGALIAVDIMLAECPKCLVSYCANCLKPYHGLHVECQPSLTGEQDKASEQLKKQTCKKCPGCAAPIEKNLGCDHMICRKCQHQFCWLCLNQWTLVHKCVALPNSPTIYHGNGVQRVIPEPVVPVVYQN